MLPDPSGKATRDESELVAGFEFAPWTFALDADYQARKLACCGIDPAIWGDCLDPSHFALLTIRHVHRDGFSINGSVHMIQVTCPCSCCGTDQQGTTSSLHTTQATHLRS